jgi:hypothetical protein
MFFLQQNMAKFLAKPEEDFLAVLPTIFFFIALHLVAFVRVVMTARHAAVLRR